MLPDLPADSPRTAHADGVPGDVLMERLWGKFELSSEEMDEWMQVTRRVREVSHPQ